MAVVAVVWLVVVLQTENHDCSSVRISELDDCVLLHMKNYCTLPVLVYSESLSLAGTITNFYDKR